MGFVARKRDIGMSSSFHIMHKTNFDAGIKDAANCVYMLNVLLRKCFFYLIRYVNIMLK